MEMMRTEAVLPSDWCVRMERERAYAWLCGRTVGGLQSRKNRVLALDGHSQRGDSTESSPQTHTQEPFAWVGSCSDASPFRSSARRSSKLRSAVTAACLFLRFVRPQFRMKMRLKFHSLPSRSSTSPDRLLYRTSYRDIASRGSWVRVMSRDNNGAERLLWVYYECSSDNSSMGSTSGIGLPRQHVLELLDP